MNATAAVTHDKSLVVGTNRNAFRNEVKFVGRKLFSSDAMPNNDSVVHAG